MSNSGHLVARARPVCHQSKLHNSLDQSQSFCCHRSLQLIPPPSASIPSLFLAASSKQTAGDSTLVQEPALGDEEAFAVTPQLAQAAVLMTAKPTAALTCAADECPPLQSSTEGHTCNTEPPAPQEYATHNNHSPASVWQYQPRALCPLCPANMAAIAYRYVAATTMAWQSCILHRCSCHCLRLSGSASA